MQDFLIKILEALVKFNDWFFSPIDGLVEKISMPEWALDAFLDSIHMLGFLFLVFVLIDLVEYFYSG